MDTKVKSMPARASALAVALVAALSLATVGAAAAQGHEWKKGPNGETTVTSEAVTCSGGPFILQSKISNINIKLRAEGVSCNEGSRIYNEGGAAKDLGSLTFNGVTVVEPAIGCEVEGGSLTTEPIKTELIGLEGRAYDLFQPASGSIFVVLPIIECILEGEYPLVGDFAGEGNLFGIYTTPQPLVFGLTVDGKIKATAEAHTGTAYGIRFGASSMTLSGLTLNSLASGEAFGSN